MTDERNEVSTSHQQVFPECPKPFKQAEPKNILQEIMDLPVLPKPSREDRFKSTLDAMIETQGVSGLLDLIGELCREKQGVLEELNGTRNPEALKWWAAAVHIEHASNKITMSGL